MGDILWVPTNPWCLERRAKKLKGLRTVLLAAVTSNIAATALFEKADFVEYGRKEEALLVANRFCSESLMAKKL